MSGGHTLTDRTSSIRYEAWARNAVAFIRSKGLETEFSDWCGGWPVPVAGTEALIAAAPDLLWPVGSWLSAALDDPNVCEEMKADIRQWFNDGGHVRQSTPAPDCDGEGE